MKQEQAQKQTTTSVDDEPTAEPKHLEKNVDEGKIDDILDEIDELLEPNAQEFVNAYVQKGGE